MGKIGKGNLGYLKEKKKLNLIATIIAFTVVLAVFLIGLIIFKNKNNIMTLVSVVLVLPAAKIAVGYFILLPHKSCDLDMVNNLESSTDKMIKLYDLVISNSKKPVGVQALIVSEKCICAYTEEKNTDPKFFEKSVTDFIKNEKLNVSVSLYTDKETFLKRVNNLNTNFDSANKENIDKMNWNKEALLHMCI